MIFQWGVVVLIEPFNDLTLFNARMADFFTKDPVHHAPILKTLTTLEKNFNQFGEEAPWFFCVSDEGGNILGAGVHTPQLFGHSCSMKPGFSPHAPLAAHPGQSFERSMHSSVHTPHDTEHLPSIVDGFLAHSPARAHAAHSGSLS